MLFLDASDANPGKRTCSDDYGEAVEEVSGALVLTDISAFIHCDSNA